MLHPGSEEGFDKRDRGVEQADVIQIAHHQSEEGGTQEKAVGASFQGVTVVLNQAQNS